jgi:hypothetical protein
MGIKDEWGNTISIDKMVIAKDLSVIGIVTDIETIVNEDGDVVDGNISFTSNGRYNCWNVDQLEVLDSEVYIGFIKYNQLETSFNEFKRLYNKLNE